MKILETTKTLSLDRKEVEEAIKQYVEKKKLGKVDCIRFSLVDGEVDGYYFDKAIVEVVSKK